MSVITNESNIYIGLVKNQLDAEWFDSKDKAIPTPSSMLKKLLDAKNCIEVMTIEDCEGVTDCYGNEAESFLIHIQCSTEADAMSLKSDIEDWNEQQTEDCFCYIK